MQRPGIATTGFALYLVAQAHTLTEPVALPALASALLWAGWSEQLDFARGPSLLEWLLGAVVLAWLLTTVTGVDPFQSFRLSVPALAACIAIFALGREKNAAQSQEWILGALLLVASVHAGAVIVTALGGTVEPQVRVDRSSAPWLVVPNDLAWAGCLWPLWRRLPTRLSMPGLRPWVISLLLIQLVALVVLHSRLGILLAALALMLDLRWTARRGLLAIAVAGSSAAAIALLVPELAEKGWQGAHARLQLWQAAWRTFLDHPWLGTGPHSFAQVHPAYLDSAYADARLSAWPHSLPLEVLAAGGLILAAPALALLAFSARCAWTRQDFRPAVAVPILLLCLAEASMLRAWWWALVVLWVGSVFRKTSDQGFRGFSQSCQPDDAGTGSRAPPS